MILHVDMDAFYASVEEREQPRLRGRPVVVGGRPERRGVVAAANYEARRYGVHSAMPAAQAQRLCPQAIFLPPRMSLYAEESTRIRAIMSRYTPLVEPLSLDEAFLDVTGSERLFGGAEAIGRRIKRDISEQTGLVASVGVAQTKFVAKIASDFDKPDGFVYVAPDAVQQFLDPLPLATLWGVGRATGERFARLGVRTIGALRELPRSMLEELFGRHGEHLWHLAHGIDPREVVPERAAKSISHETTFGHDVEDFDELRAHLHALVEQVVARLRRAERRASKVQVKIRFDDFRTITRAATLASPDDSTRVIRERCERLFAENVTRMPGDAGRLSPPVRLIGAGVAGFETEQEAAVQPDLFAEPQVRVDRQIDHVVDRIRDRYGTEAVRRGHRPSAAPSTPPRSSPRSTHSE